MPSETLKIVKSLQATPVKAADSALETDFIHTNQARY